MWKTGKRMNKKIYHDVISGKSDYNIKYSDLQNLILELGFEFKRQRGSHTIYYHSGINELLNIQKDGSKAKGYEVKQLRNIIIKHNL